MKLRKLLAVTAVAATMTAAFAVSAMAEVSNVLSDGNGFAYDAGKGTITIDATSQHDTTGSPYTVLVVATDGEGLDENTGLDTTFDNIDIKQIDESNAKFGSIAVGTLAPGKYEIRLGGDGNVRWGTLEVKAADPEPESPYTDPTRLLGDVDGNKEVNIFDVNPIVLHVLEKSVLSGDALNSADADCNLEVNIFDVNPIVLYVLDKDSNVDGKKTLSARENPVPEITVE